MVINYNRRQRTVRLGLAGFGFFSILALTVFFIYETFITYTPHSDHVFTIVLGAIAFVLACFDIWLGDILYEQVIDYLDE